MRGHTRSVVAVGWRSRTAFTGGLAPDRSPQPRSGITENGGIRDERREEHRTHDRGRREPGPRKERRDDATTGPNRCGSTRHAARTHAAVAVESQAPHTGYVDGAWWPHSDYLTTELPDLLAVLSVRLGPIDRVLFKLTDWAKAPTKLATGGRAVHLDGYRLQPPNTVEVIGLNGNRIILLVVPPTPTRTAHMPP